MHARVALVGVLSLAACAQATPVPPGVGAVIVVRGFSFELPGLSPTGAGGADAPVSIRAGPAVYRVVNDGSAAHEVRVMRMRGGAGAQDAVQHLLGAGSRTPPGEFVDGRVEVPAGGEGRLEVDLTPGGYILVCTLPDPATGQPYAARGLVRDLSVSR
jgi:hypothetical protein